MSVVCRIQWIILRVFGGFNYCSVWSGPVINSCCAPVNGPVRVWHIVTSFPCFQTVVCFSVIFCDNFRLTLRVGLNWTCQLNRTGWLAQNRFMGLPIRRFHLIVLCLLWHFCRRFGFNILPLFFYCSVFLLKYSFIRNCRCFEDYYFIFSVMACGWHVSQKICEVRRFLFCHSGNTHSENAHMLFSLFLL